MNTDIRAISELIQRESAGLERVRKAIGQVIVGQSSLVDRMLIALLCDGHLLLEGVPGLAKTLAAKTLSSAIEAKFQRIQFTPDLLPADVTGTLIYDMKDQKFITRKGPIFANFILADEINRAPAKVQSALLEAMQERQVTIGEQTFKLPTPFLVIATQNPLEQEGTYPLPEAQLDRFLMKVVLTYPSREEERIILREQHRILTEKVDPVLNPAQLLKTREVCNEIYTDEKIENYILDLIVATRDPVKAGIKELDGMIRYGASPRASINLIACARAHAFLQKRGYVLPEDVRAIGTEVLRHRIGLSYEAEAQDWTPDRVVKLIFDRVIVP